MIPINLTANVLTNIVIFPDRIALYLLVFFNISSNGKLMETSKAEVTPTY